MLAIVFVPAAETGTGVAPHDLPLLVLMLSSDSSWQSEAEVALMEVLLDHT